MSLINDALKRAQKQRTGDSPPVAAMPGVGGETAVKIAKRDKPVGFNLLLIRLGLGAGAVLVLALGGFFTWRAVRSQPDSPSPARLAVAAATSPKPVEPAATPAGSTASTKPFVLPIAPPPAPEPAAVVQSAKPEPKPEPAITPAAAPPPPPPPAKLEPRAVTYIENLRIAGIRASATDSKVLMNDRVYRVGDTVEHELGLKLTGITANSLTFVDERGGIYSRQF